MKLNAAVLSGAILVLLAGCSSPSPVAGTDPPSTAPSVTPSPTLDTAVVSLTLSPDELSALNSAGEVVASASLHGDVGAAVELLEQAFGAEPSTYQQGEGCTVSEASLTSWRWGAANEPSVAVDSWATWSTDQTWREANDFYVRFNQSSEAGVALETSGGVAIGDSAAAVFADVPSERLSPFYGDADYIAVVDVGGSFETSSGPRAWGVVVASQGGSVWALSSPSSGAEFYC